jgi:predicted nucleic acid-binding protein
MDATIPGNRVLKCAAEASSGYIVAEDKDLLRLGQYAVIRIVNAADFMRILIAERQKQK